MHFGCIKHLLSAYIAHMRSRVQPTILLKRRICGGPSQSSYVFWFVCSAAVDERERAVTKPLWPGQDSASVGKFMFSQVAESFWTNSQCVLVALLF